MSAKHFADGRLAQLISYLLWETQQVPTNDVTPEVGPSHFALRLLLNCSRKSMASADAAAFGFCFLMASTSLSLAAPAASAPRFNWPSRSCAITRETAL